MKRVYKPKVCIDNDYVSLPIVNTDNATIKLWNVEKDNFVTITFEVVEALYKLIQKKKDKL
jgi:hypothetical protein